MRRYRRFRCRRFRNGSLLILILSISVCLVSCVAGGNSSWVRSLLGTDVKAYRKEAPVSVHSTDETLAEELESSLEMLISDSVELREIHSTKDAVKNYRDALLNSLMRSNYSGYVGNPGISRSIREQYPYLNASAAIPASDFESAALRCFGTYSVSNRDGRLFSYLSKAACYLAPSQPIPLSVELTPDALTETEHTYRYEFTLSDPDGNTASYLAMFVKRSDGGAYIKALFKNV